MTYTARQLAWFVPDLRLSRLRLVLSLPNAVPPVPLIPGEFPAHRPLADPESVANLGVCCARLP